MWFESLLVFILFKCKKRPNIYGIRVVQYILKIFFFKLIFVIDTSLVAARHLFRHFLLLKNSFESGTSLLSLLQQAWDLELTQRTLGWDVSMKESSVGTPLPLLSPQECHIESTARSSQRCTYSLLCPLDTTCTHTHLPKLLLGVTGCDTRTPTFIFSSIKQPLPCPAVMITDCDFWMSTCSLTVFCPPRAHLSDIV